MEFEITDYVTRWESVSDDAYLGGRYVDLPTVTTVSADVEFYEPGETRSVGREDLLALFGHQAVQDAEEAIEYELYQG